MQKLTILTAFLGLTFTGCADPTEVVLFVDTTLAVPCDVDNFRVTVTGQGEPVTQDIPASAGLSSWTLVKDGGGDNFAVRVDARKGNTVVASANADVEFRALTSQSIDFILDESCRDTVCDRSDDLGTLSVPAAATRGTCKPEVNRYEVEDLTGLIAIVDACESVGGPFESFTGLSSDEVEVTAEAITDFIANDFDFNFYGLPLEGLFVSDDGYLNFNSSPVNATFDQRTNLDGITSAGHPTFSVLPFWDNVSFQAGGELCVAVVDAGGQQTLWATWKGGCLGPACPANDNLQFSVGLEEGTDRVIVGFDTMISTAEQDRAAGGEAVVGVIGPGEPACDASVCSADGLCPDSTPCGFTQIFSRTVQTAGWPAIYAFDPIEEAL